MKLPEKGIPRDLLDKAECVVIVPGFKKGDFLSAGSTEEGSFLAGVVRNVEDLQLV
jgi:SH3 domain-containing YSC84-like protein 1